MVYAASFGIFYAVLRLACLEILRQKLTISCMCCLERCASLVLPLGKYLDAGNVDLEFVLTPASTLKKSEAGSLRVKFHFSSLHVGAQTDLYLNRTLNSCIDTIVKAMVSKFTYRSSVI